MALLGRDYWLVMSHPLPHTTTEDIERVAPVHISWLLELEESGALFVSGPLLEGPGVRPGTGVTVLRAADAAEAADVAGQDPFVLARLRTPTIYRWRLNEGAVDVKLSLGAGTFRWG